MVDVEDAQLAGFHHQTGGVDAHAVVAVRKEFLNQFCLALLQTLYAERHSAQVGNLLLGVTQRKMAQAKEEAKRPFAQEAELAEKSVRLAELNSLLNMDEKGSEDALGVDEDAAETEVADRPRQPVNYAGRVAERTADNVRKPSVLAQLHAKQAERSAEPQKSQKRKSHEMEL